MKYLTVLLLAGCADIAPEPTIDNDMIDDSAIMVAPIPVEPSILESDIAIDYDFASEEVSIILDSAYMWQVKTNGRVNLKFHVCEVEFGEPHSIARVDYIDGENVAGWTDVENQSMALAYSVIGSYTDVGVSYEELFRVAALHELGHAIGLGHIDSNKCIMTGLNGVTVADASIFEPQPCDIKLFNERWP